MKKWEEEVEEENEVHRRLDYHFHNKIVKMREEEIKLTNKNAVNEWPVCEYILVCMDIFWAKISVLSVLFKFHFMSMWDWPMYKQREEKIVCKNRKKKTLEISHHRIFNDKKIFFQKEYLARKYLKKRHLRWERTL